MDFQDDGLPIFSQSIPAEGSAVIPTGDAVLNWASGYTEWSPGGRGDTARPALTGVSGVDSIVNYGE